MKILTSIYQLLNYLKQEKLVDVTARVKARRVAEGFVASGHFGLFFLAAVDQLAITIPSEFQFLVLLADNSTWLPIHLVCGLVVSYTIFSNRGHIRSLGLSAGFMGAWGFFNLFAGLTANKPVSLAGPVLGLALSGVAYSVAMSWAEDTHLLHRSDQ